MAGPDIVMYEVEFNQIKTILAKLRTDSNAQVVFLVDKNGQLIASAGDTHEIDTTSLASLTAGNIAATGGIARLLGETSESRREAGSENEEASQGRPLGGCVHGLLVARQEQTASALAHHIPSLVIARPACGPTRSSPYGFAQSLELVEPEGVASVLRFSQ